MALIALHVALSECILAYMDEGIPYMALVARNVRIARAAVVPKLSQAGLAARMRALGFGEWRRQTVGNTENGKRRLTAEELLGLALALDTTVSSLDRAAGDDSGFPGGQQIIRLPGFAMPVWRIGMNDGSLRWDGNVPVIGEPRFAYNPPLAPWPDQQPSTQEEDVQPVVAAIVTSPLGVLVGRRNDGKPPWTFIAGEVEPGERPEDAAVREVKEETTLRIESGDIIGQRVHPKTGRTMIYLAATPVHGTEIHVGDEDELAEVRWVGLAEADELLPGMFEPVHEYLARELGEG